MELTPLPIPLYAVPLWIVTAVGGLLALLTARYHYEEGAYPLFAVFAGAVLWAGGYAMQIAAPSGQQALVWFNVRLVGSTIVPTAIFVLALQFTGHRRLVRPLPVAGLFAIPLVTDALIWTNYRGLWIEAYRYNPDPAVWIQLTVDWGPWFAVYTFYSLGVAFAAIALFANQARAGAGSSIRTKSAAFLLATVLPTLGTFLHVGGFTVIDYGPFAFVVSGLLIMAAMFYL